MITRWTERKRPSKFRKTPYAEIAKGKKSKKIFNLAANRLHIEENSGKKNSISKEYQAISEKIIMVGILKNFSNPKWFFIVYFVQVRKKILKLKLQLPYGMENRGDIIN
ncbi:hypothetical protein M9H77_09371 [Catharanthus roseus]|uniref:Uncharacterized protein n=1 Tax=Catharanthus roseus TaxID=4058 RepID=A0ACC0C0G7_CATRO|nr:hypothetical protein M9H77_09371 [Catharanthus roseus]